MKKSFVLTTLFLTILSCGEPASNRGKSFIRDTDNQRGQSLATTNEYKFMNGTFETDSLANNEILSFNLLTTTPSIEFTRTDKSLDPVVYNCYVKISGTYKLYNTSDSEKKKFTDLGLEAPSFVITTTYTNYSLVTASSNTSNCSGSSASYVELKNSELSAGNNVTETLYFKKVSDTKFTKVISDLVFTKN